jgi:hypothetical protein
MRPLTLKAHFDGKHVVLDEPYDLKPDTPIVVTVLPDSAEIERAQWHGLSSSNLERAYGENEPEYTDSDIKP